jgi:hypothetical protein
VESALTASTHLQDVLKLRDMENAINSFLSRDTGLTRESGGRWARKVMPGPSDQRTASSV